jgi:hypothetical protein
MAHCIASEFPKILLTASHDVEVLGYQQLKRSMPVSSCYQQCGRMVGGTGTGNAFAQKKSERVLDITF